MNFSRLKHYWHFCHIIRVLAAWRFLVLFNIYFMTPNCFCGLESYFEYYSYFKYSIAHFFRQLNFRQKIQFPVLSNHQQPATFKLRRDWTVNIEKSFMVDIKKDDDLARPSRTLAQPRRPSPTLAPSFNLATLATLAYTLHLADSHQAYIKLTIV